MSKLRPLIAKKGPELEQLARHNWNDKVVLENILDELRCRHRAKAAKLRDAIGGRLMEFENKDLRSDDGLACFENRDVLAMVGYDDNLSDGVVERQTILRFVNELSGQKMPAGSGDPKSATRRLLVLECLLTRMSYARKTRAKILSAKLRDDIRFVEEDFF